MSRAEELRAQIIDLVREYHGEQFTPKPFKPGNTMIPTAGRVFDDNELALLTESSLDFWLTTGRFAAEFEERFAEFMNVRHCVLVNSGSSANLVAMTALTSPKLGDRQLKPGDEVLT